MNLKENNMKLVVGLGNPGKEYDKTRHNCGFRAIDFYADKNNLSFKSKFNGLYCDLVVNNEKLLLLKPQTFMNLSGDCVIQFMKYFNLKNEDLLVIYDDSAFETGTFKIRRGGSSAGHNGIKDIINKLHTENIARVRIGISKNNIPLMDYVLGRFGKEDDEKVNAILSTIENVINDFTKLSIDELMQKYNGNHNEG
jgi:PTH1 family peptidyl-tRNA hydrolase